VATHGTQRLALEVDHAVPVAGDQDLAQVVVAVDPRQQRRAREGLEDGEFRGDRRREAAQGPTRLARRHVHRADQLALCRPRPRAQLVAGRLPRFEFRDATRVGQGRVHRRGQGAQLGGHLGGEFDADLPGGQQPAGQRFGDRLVRVDPVGHEGLDDGHGRGTGRGRDDLRVAGQRRDGGKPRDFGQEGDELELGIEAGLEPPVALDQQALADDHGGVRLIRAERALGQASHDVGATRGEIRQGGGRPAD
jgi:hypothetical protein